MTRPNKTDDAARAQRPITAGETDPGDPHTHSRVEMIRNRTIFHIFDAGDAVDRSPPQRHDSRWVAGRAGRWSDGRCARIDWALARPLRDVSEATPPRASCSRTMTGTIRPPRGHAIGSGHCNSLQLPQSIPWKMAWCSGRLDAPSALNIRILARPTVFAGIRLMASHQNRRLLSRFPTFKCVPRPKTPGKGHLYQV